MSIASSSFLDLASQAPAAICHVFPTQGSSPPWLSGDVQLLNLRRGQRAIVDADLIERALERIVVAAGAFACAANHCIRARRTAEICNAECLIQHPIHIQLSGGRRSNHSDVRPRVYRWRVVEREETAS